MQDGRSQSALGQLSGVSENYPILLRPSEWLRKGERQVDKDVEVILASFAGLFLELLKGAIKDRAIQHHIATLPGQVPQYRENTCPLPDDRLKILKETLTE